MDPISMRLVADDIIMAALREDITFEDVSTASVCPAARPAEVQLIAKGDGVVAGLDVFARTFALLDPQTCVEATVADGDEVGAGQRLAIVPSWQDYDTDRVKLILDPGLAFGTGGHETTNLCLEVLDERVKGGERVLDIGTGSGILAIAALKLGAASAEGVDIDPVAVRTAGENAALNGVADKLTVLVGDLSNKASGKYDIITANIVANAILSLAPAVPGLMADGATFIASGIIDSRKDEVLAGLQAAGLAVVEVKEKRGWECIVCKKS